MSNQRIEEELRAWLKKGTMNGEAIRLITKTLAHIKQLEAENEKLIANAPLYRVDESGNAEMIECSICKRKDEVLDEIICDGDQNYPLQLGGFCTCNGCSDKIALAESGKGETK